MTARPGWSDDDASKRSEHRRHQIGRIRHTADVVAERVAAIHDRAIRESPYLKSGNFQEIDPSDLDRMFALYDNAFFEGLLRRMLVEDRAYPVRMRLSSRLTRSAGKTVQSIDRRRVPPIVGYEIAVSTTLLMGTFRTAERVVESSGLVCRDRLEALQRTFEHELLHLAEFLAWGRSCCSEPNFHVLSTRIFAHEGVRHNLVTPRERAAVEFDIRVGDPVVFDFNREAIAGLVHRITRRVTVLVADPFGDMYSDGRRYQRYYVPMERLRKASRD